MSLEYQKRLESEIDRELKSLPELPAPPSLLLRVLAAIEQRLNLPWYKRSWQRWPVGLRVLSLALLLALFGAICFGSWKLTHLESFATALQRAGGWFASLGALWHVLLTVLNAMVLAIKYLGTGFIIACFVALGLGYGLCMGLGTYYVRLGLARRYK